MAMKNIVLTGLPFQPEFNQVFYIENEYDLPCMGIEKEYINTSTGQLRTRFQACVEALEIKKLFARR